MEVLGDTGWATVDENLLGGDEGATVAALNLFVRSPVDDRWRIVCHHGSVVNSSMSIERGETPRDRRDRRRVRVPLRRRHRRPEEGRQGAGIVDRVAPPAVVEEQMDLGRRSGQLADPGHPFGQLGVGVPVRPRPRVFRVLAPARGSGPRRRRRWPPPPRARTAVPPGAGRCTRTPGRAAPGARGWSRTRSPPSHFGLRSSTATRYPSSRVRALTSSARVSGLGDHHDGYCSTTTPEPAGVLQGPQRVREAVPALVEDILGQVVGVQPAAVTGLGPDRALQVLPERIGQGRVVGQQRPRPHVEAEPRSACGRPTGGPAPGWAGTGRWWRSRPAAAASSSRPAAADAVMVRRG